MASRFCALLSLLVLVMWHSLCPIAMAAYPPSRSDAGIPKFLLEEFEYIPTVQGYRYSYKLPDGTTREEIAIITNSLSDTMGRGDLTDIADRDSSDRSTFRPGGNLKNRKLSPKSLASLAG